MQPVPDSSKIRVTKSGLALPSFENVSLYKDVEKVSDVSSLEDALSRVGNDEKTLLAIIQSGLQETAKENARADSSGWLKASEEAGVADSLFSEDLANMEIVNPVLLQLAKLHYDYDEASERMSQAKSPADKEAAAEDRRVAKASAMEHIRNDKQIVASLVRKSQKAAKAQG